MGFFSRIGSAWSAFRNNVTSLDIFRYLYGGSPSAAGENVNAETAMRCAAVYACVRVLSESVAQLPLHVYRRKTGGGKSRSYTHPVYRLLNERPNPWQTAFEYREMLMGHLCLRGNAYSFKNIISTGDVVDLIPLHPDRMEVKQLPDYTLQYIYQPNGKPAQTLNASQVWHLRGLSADGIKGINPIEQAKEPIGLALATEKHGAKLFRNGAMPSGVLKHSKLLSEKAQANLKTSFEERYSGTENAHRPMILEEGMDWASISMNSEDAQFLETRKYQRSEIASIFRVPPHKIGDLDKATFSNIEQQSIEFVTDSLLPWLRRWEQSIALNLIAPAERSYTFAEHLVDGLLRGDIASRYAAYAIGRQNGWLNANDVREKENMDPIEGPEGSAYLVNGNMIPAGMAGQKANSSFTLTQNEVVAALKNAGVNPALIALATAAA
jgi:HK97 family phage portal protein